MAPLACGGDDSSSPAAEEATVDASSTNTADDSSIDGDSGIADATSNADSSNVELDSGLPPFALRANASVNALHHMGNAWFLGGEFTAVNGALLPRFGTLNADGSVVSTCDLGAGFDGEIRAIAKSAGAYFIGGHFAHYKGQAVAGLVKIDASTCALDTTFSQPGNGLSGGGAYVDALVVVGNAVYIGGYFTGYRGVANAAISLAKLDATSGAIDTTFSPVGATANGVGVGYTVYALAAAPDALYVGGYFTAYRGVAASANWIAKVDLTSGVLDTTFSPPANNGFNGYVGAIAVSGSSLYVGGGFTSYRGVANAAKHLAKMDRVTGDLDTTFTKPNLGFEDSDTIRALAVSANAVFVGGVFTSYRGVANAVANIAKVDLNTGNLDTTFNPPGAVAPGQYDAVQALAVTSNALYMGGMFDSYRGQKGAGSFAKLDPVTGAVDTTFHPSGDTARGFGPSETVFAIWADSTNVAVGGYFGHYAGKAAHGIAKVNDVSYAFDATFAGDGSGFDQFVSSITSIGSSLYVGGAFTSYRGVANSARQIAKLDATTGALDTTFSPPGGSANGFDGYVGALAHSDTALYAGGHFSGYRGVANSAKYIAKLDPSTGALDTTFSPPGANGFDGDVFALDVANGNVYAGGIFTSYRGVTDSARRIAKLSATTGAIDTAFNPPGALANGFDDDVLALLVNGTSVYVGGDFNTYRGVDNSAEGIAKLDSTTGALDTTFTMAGNGNGFNSSIYCFAVSGGALYAGGDMSAYRGKPAQGIAKLDLLTGALDTTFSPNMMDYGFENSVYAIVPQGDSVFASGYFRTYRGAPSLRVERLDPTSGAAR